jgi:ATP-dependent Clp endopeptidase proteolytic subunit ClpP
VKEGHIFIDDIITPETLAQVKAKLEEYKALPAITLHIQSPGGSVYAGYNIYHALKLSGKKIKTIIEGEAQSMATFISSLGHPKNGGLGVEICNPSVFMVHLPHSGVEGTAEQFEQGASELRNIENDMVAEYSAVTGLPEEQVREMMRKTTTMTAQQAKDYGFATKVLGSYLQAVAIGQTIKKPMEKKEAVLTKVIKMLADLTGLGPSAIDLPVQGGKMLHIDGEGGDLIGRPATIDGAPASGSIPLTDGRTVMCENGIVMSVSETPAQQTPPPAQPPAPTPAPVQTAEQKLAAAESELAKIKAEKAAAEAAKAAAEQKAAEAVQQTQTTVQALADIKTELETIKTETTVGNDNPPAGAMTPYKQPMGMAPSAAAEQKKRTVQFLNEFMPWLKQYYPQGEFEKYAAGPNMVSILETNFNYTWPGILTTEIFYKPTLQAPALSDIFTIDQGISFKKKYNLITQLDKILKPYTGCTRVFNGNRQLITNTEVVVKEFSVSESWCKDDFTQQLSGAYNLLAQEWLKTGNRSFDPSGTPINTIIDRILSDALQRDVFRRVSFGAGNSSDDDYNQIDGLWDRLIDSSGASNYCVVRAGSALGTGALSAGAALTALEAVYANSNILLKNAPGKKFFVTRSIWDNLYNSYIGSGAVTEQQFENLVKGLTTLTYKGIPVIPVDLWDSFLAESDNPLFATTRHLILLTVKENHILGVEQGGDLNKIEGWYERKDRKFYYEADMKFGYNYLHCDLQTIAY